MDMALSELPLALFTTLAPIGAGGFAIMALIACFSSAREEDGATSESRKSGMAALAKWTVVPFLVTCVGFLSAAADTANPMHGFGVFAGLGRSPLANEVFVGALFMVAALVFAIMAIANASEKPLKVFSVIAAVLAVLFSLSIGMAYMVPTIISWDVIALPLEILGFALLGGSALYALIAQCSHISLSDAKASKSLSVVSIIGGIIAICAVAAHLMLVSGMSTAVSQGSHLIAAVAPMITVGLVLLAVATCILAVYFRKPAKTSFAAIAVICALVGVFLVRMSFYALYLSVGVTPLL